MSHPSPSIRIAKLIANAGITSRRSAESWIAEGRICVDGKLVTSPGIKLSGNESLTLDSKPLDLSQAFAMPQLWLFHKPKGCLTTHHDPKGRPTIFDHITLPQPHIITVGRLDYNSEGLLLLTNKGELARYLTLPKHRIERTYRVRAYGSANEKELKHISGPLTIEGVRYNQATTLSDHQGKELQQKTNHWFTMTLTEGKNREVRHRFEHIDLIVNRLIRTEFGPFSLGKLKVGMVKEVPSKKLQTLLKGVGFGG